MNIALIFAGGTGTRMNSRSKPKQLLELHGKPIIIHTLEAFEKHSKIDEILVVSLESAIPDIKKGIQTFGISKVKDIIVGGDTGFESIFRGLEALLGKCSVDDLVLIHDGVRPLVSESEISLAIDGAAKYGNAISAVPVTEGIVFSDDGEVVIDFPERKKLFATKAPQVFKFSIIYELYKQAKSEGYTPVESAHLCYHYGIDLHLVMASPGNIKVTTATDYYVLKAVYDAVENAQIIGL